MKKTAIIASAVAFLFFTASVNAQTDTVPKQSAPVEAPVTAPAPVETQTPVTTPATTTPTTTTGSNDRWNNYDKSKYAMLPMPEALTTEKIFPVIGTYQLTSDKDQSTSQVTITLDETNKGLVWIDGLPEGRIKAQLRQSPGTYKIPEQKIGEDKDAKTVAEGVVMYDKDANTMNVCVGCKYNAEDPGTAFLPASEEPATVAETKTKTKNGKVTKSKTKVAKVKPVHYTGTKQIQENAVAPAPAMN